MKQHRFLVLCVVLAFLCPLVAMNFAGCESSSHDSDDDSATNAATFNIVPQTVTLVASNTPSQVFTAVAGKPAYAWELSSATLGSLNTTIGNSVTYTATTNIGQNILTARDGNDDVATAVIKQE